MKRTITKRIELNELEAKHLRMKAEQCGLSEADYLRELIMNSQPVEAPPRQFYEQMEKVNRIASRIQRICATAEGKDAVAELRSLYVQLIGHIVEIKECVSKARFFALGAYQDWERQVELAKKEGRIPPTLKDYNPDDHSRDIKNPATDPDLGWNALGIRPPFLDPAAPKGGKDADDGWMNADDQGTNQQNAETSGEKSNPQDEQSIVSYASSNVFMPPRKAGDP